MQFPRGNGLLVNRIALETGLRKNMDSMHSRMNGAVSSRAAIVIVIRRVVAPDAGACM